MDIRKRAAFLVILYNLVLFNYFKKYNQNDVCYNSEYVYESAMPFASVNDRNVYILNKDILGDITDYSNGDIFICDMRDSVDPNMKVLNSYKIKSLKDIKSILEIMKKYERIYPSEWDRTVFSMAYEWLMHNIAYGFDLYIDHSADVDLNNDDEMKLIFK